MSERYVPPPPPYELSLQYDQKVTEEVQALELSKGSPFRDEDCKDSKHSRALVDKSSRDVAIHTLPGIPKRSARSDSASLRAPRPLPPSPVNTRPLYPQGQGGKFRPVVEIEAYAAQNDHSREPHPPAPPPFSAIRPSLNEPPYPQSMHHPSSSVNLSPFHYPSQSSYDTPRRNYDNRRPTSAYSPTEPCAETPFKRSSHIPLQTPSYPLPQNKNYGTRLSFDPSVAYSDSQASTRATIGAQRGAAVSLYSSAVSSYLHSDSAVISGSRQSYAPARPPTLWNTEKFHLDKTDVRSVRTHPSDPMYPSSPTTTTSLYTPRPRPSGGYEQRWATSESDITRDSYPG